MPEARKRKALSKKTRFEVFKRDGFTCAYCGNQPPKVILHCDHVIAVASGGTNDIDNLVTACDACNQGKGARELSAVPLTIEQKAETMREREEQVRAFNDLAVEKRSRIEDTAWTIANELLYHWCEPADNFPRNWFTSIERFVERLPLHDLLEAANLAGGRFPNKGPRSFKYFCGVCWSKIRDAEDG